MCSYEYVFSLKKNTKIYIFMHQCQYILKGQIKCPHYADTFDFKS